jgi:hypothetical protein
MPTSVLTEQAFLWLFGTYMEQTIKYSHVDPIRKILFLGTNFLKHYRISQLIGRKEHNFIYLNNLFYMNYKNVG